ncbi:DNA pilot protein [Sigmofec virus UA08Rod_4687]|uniref:DNA pilot protein n=1 Tax=Sigmofec virus UA08Rod_4687 TaxID=2929407 RepID=A0A976N1B7_9VIRU|nr:DNA pilot protein [Sigmofec virus UA08Rod_4687]
MPSSALIGGALGLANSVANMAYDTYSNKRNYNQTKSLMALQNRMNIDNWNMQNAYNAPSAVKQRLLAAGINPDVAFGNGANQISSPLSGVGLGSAPSSMPLGADIASPTLQGMMVDSQIELNKANARKASAEAGNTEALTPWVSKQAASSLRLSDSQVKFYNESVEKIRSETELNRVTQSINKRIDKFEQVLYDKKVESTLEQLGATAEQSRAIIKRFSEYYAAEIGVMLSQSYNNYQSGRSASENAVSTRISANAAAYNARTSRLNVENTAYNNNAQLHLDKKRYELQKALNDSNIKEADVRIWNAQIKDQWKKDLNDTGVVGRVIANILDIPASILKFSP